jgi:hypothetical protein
MIGLGASEVINHAAPTFCIQVPMFDATDASHRARNSGCRSGLQADRCVGSAENMVTLAARKEVKSNFYLRSNTSISAERQNLGIDLLKKNDAIHGNTPVSSWSWIWLDRASWLADTARIADRVSTSPVCEMVFKC